MIKVRGLQKYFVKDGNRIEVLKGIDLTVDRGDSLAIVGVSGAGKSTLLHILGALDRPSGGEVTYNDLDVFKWDDNKLAGFRNRTIGFVFQFHHLLPEFTSRENVSLPAMMAGLPKKKALARADEVLTEMGLGERIGHKPGELSGGEQQRVAVARALIMDPEVILADEPTGNLDTETGGRVEEILLSLNVAKKITLLAVTHNEALAGRMARRIGIKDGMVYTDG